MIAQKELETLIALRNQLRMLKHLYRTSRWSIRQRMNAGAFIEQGVHDAQIIGSRLLIFCLVFWLVLPVHGAVPIFFICAEPGDQRLQAIVSVFVSGNNQAAEKARDTLRNEKTCLRLAPNAAESDAVLEIALESQSQGGVLRSFGGRASIASGTLTLKSGDLVWSRSYRFSDAPFGSGGKVAGDLLVRRLAKEAGCKRRFK
jgi:hypothetical protein